MQIANNTVVSIDYTLTNDNGDVVDSSQGREPLVYLHGAGNIIPGLENALLGKSKGDQTTVRVTPAEGYGERNEQLQQTVSKEMFGDAAVEVGVQYQAATPDGQPVVITVVGMEGDDVTIDGNHPLAGEHLNFDVTIVEIREATEEEIEHGHAHGIGGHNH